MKAPKSILITGASSGIGAALALASAGPGVSLALTGRDPIRLAGTANRCRTAGAEVRTAIVDVTDRAGMTDFVRARDTERALDLVIANAGVSYGTGSLNLLDDRARQTFAVNVDGVLNTIHPAIALMAPRRRGQLALMSSLAGFRGLPGSGAYAASKAAVRSYGESLRGQLAPLGLEVSVICPGFVRSAMTDRNNFAMPFLMDADRAAQIVLRGLERNRGRIAFPLPMYAASWFLNALPDRVAGWLTGRLPAKD
jgi:short-subunit dehydrogenase